MPVIEHQASNDTVRALQAGDAIYARRAGRKTFAWYVIDRAHDSHIGESFGAAHAHREHGSGRTAYMAFAEVRRVDRGRYAR